jgi:hypothetical protein
LLLGFVHFKKRLHLLESDPGVVQFIRGGEPGQSESRFQDENREQPDKDSRNSEQPFSTAWVSHEGFCRVQTLLGNGQV